MTHDEILEYNWDDGFTDIWLAADNPETEVATALLIFWRSDGPWLLAQSEVARVNQEARRLAAVVRDRILGGFYRHGTAKYDPIADRGLDLLQIEVFRKSGMPQALLPPHENA